MDYPTDAPSVFTFSGNNENAVAQWHSLLLCDELSSQCQLERLVFCKCTNGKEHEFLLLHFRHPIQQDAVAILVLDRVPSTDPTENNNNNNNGSGSSRPVMQSSHIASPSVSSIPARDSIFTTRNDGSAIESYLSRTYDQYKRLCHVDFAASARPLAIQVSVLLCVISAHSSMYNLYQYQCYWYAHTVCEALKRLFPDCHETTENGGRSRYLGVKIDKADSVEAVCEEYHIQWARIENAAEERRKAKEAEARQLRMEGRTEERARCQVEIDQATRRANEEAEQKEEEKRQKEEAVRRAEEEARQKEEAVRRANDEARQKEEEARRANEAERKLEEMRAEWQAEMDRMRAQYERQAV